MTFKAQNDTEAPQEKYAKKCLLFVLGLLLCYYIFFRLRPNAKHFLEMFGVWGNYTLCPLLRNVTVLRLGKSATITVLKTWVAIIRRIKEALF